MVSYLYMPACVLAYCMIEPTETHLGVTKYILSLHVTSYRAEFLMAPNVMASAYIIRNPEVGSLSVDSVH